MIGKYTKVRDSYISMVEAMKHAPADFIVRPEIKWSRPQILRLIGSSLKII